MQGKPKVLFILRIFIQPVLTTIIFVNSMALLYVFYSQGVKRVRMDRNESLELSSESEAPKKVVSVQ